MAVEDAEIVRCVVVVACETCGCVTCENEFSIQSVVSHANYTGATEFHTYSDHTDLSRVQVATLLQSTDCRSVPVQCHLASFKANRVTLP